MSKLDELIQEFCPEGVGSKSLGEVCTIKTGQPVSKVLISKNPGEYPVINSGREPLGFINKYNTENDPIGITSRGAGVGSVTWCPGKYYRGNLNYSVTVRDERFLDVRFLYFLLMQNQPGIQQLATYQGIPALNKSNLEKLQISIPPLEVQKEIVNILDKFTQLEAELSAELEARQKQYEFYRNHLLKLDVSEAVDYKTVGDICKLVRGKRLVKSELEAEGEFAVYQNSMTPLGYYDSSNFSGDTTFIISAGAAGEIGYSSKDFWAADDVYVLQPPKSMRSRYLYHALENQKRLLSTKVRRASIPRLSRISIENLSVPVPPLDQQDRIVTILDKFDTLVNDISSGIPAEINARRKQYEYYRTKLLTFQELSV